MPTAYTHRFAWEVCGKEPEKWRPTTREAADHSLPYIVAAVLIDRDFSDAIFSHERLRDPRIRQLMDKTEVREDAELTRRFPQCMPCRIEIRTKDGRCVMEETDNARGHFNKPMTGDEVTAKFRSLAKRVLPHARVEQALAALWQLDTATGVNAIFDAVKIGR